MHNKNLNKYFSMAGLVTLLIQPIAAGLFIKNPKYQMIYYTAYGLWMATFLASSYPFNLSTSVSASHHLKWNWLTASGLFVIGWTAFIITAVCLSDIQLMQKVYITMFVASLTFISWYMYNKDGSWGSVYCSFINIMFVFVIIKAFWFQYSSKYKCL